MSVKWRVKLSYRLFRQERKAEFTVEANSPREAFEAAKRQLRHQLVDEAIYAADSTWANDYQRVS